MPPSAVTECDACMKFKRKNGSADRCFHYAARTLLLIMTLATLSSGCAGGRVASPGSDYDSPETALRVIADSAARGTITATARIEISYPGERYPLKAAMMMRRPADLRLESIPILGPPDFFLSIEGGELRVFFPGKGTFSIGPATRWNISRFLRLPLPAADIVPLLMGNPPPGWETSHSRHGEREERLYRIDRYETGGRKTGSLWIDPVAGLLVRVRAFTEGETIAYTADFTDHIRLGGGFLPQRLTISGEAGSLVLRYAEIGLLDNDAASFALPIPEGISPIPLDEK
jgi:hypothetical protein